MEAAPGALELKDIPPKQQSKDQEVRAGGCLLFLLSTPTELGDWPPEGRGHPPSSLMLPLNPQAPGERALENYCPKPPFPQPCLLAKSSPCGRERVSASLWPSRSTEGLLYDGAGHAEFHRKSMRRRWFKALQPLCYRKAHQKTNHHSLLGRK